MCTHNFMNPIKASVYLCGFRCKWSCDYPATAGGFKCATYKYNRNMKVSELVYLPSYLPAAPGGSVCTCSVAPALQTPVEQTLNSLQWNINAERLSHWEPATHWVWQWNSLLLLIIYSDLQLPALLFHSDRLEVHVSNTNISLWNHTGVDYLLKSGTDRPATIRWLID